MTFIVLFVLLAFPSWIFVGGVALCRAPTWIRLTATALVAIAWSSLLAF